MTADPAPRPRPGVNLGNWLVLEKWMSPQLFSGTSAEDEVHLWRELSPVAARERFKVHRDSWVTDRDFTYLAAKGVDLIRIPVPWFLFGDHEPYIGCVNELDRAFAWAQRHGQQILIDLHTVPGSQNGFDNGGISGVCTFHTKPENVGVALDVLEQLAIRYRDHPSLWGIEVLNEPISQEVWDLADIPNRYPAVDKAEAEGSGPVPTDFLRRFYRDAYDRMRARADQLRIVFHDGFRIEDWDGYFADPDFENIVVDTHQYLMMHPTPEGQDNLDRHVAVIAVQFAGAVRALAADAPVMIGEWSLDTASGQPLDLRPDQQRAYYRAIADAQLRTYEPAVAWCFWSYKLHADEPKLAPWDMGRAIELGWLPDTLSPSAP